MKVMDVSPYKEMMMLHISTGSHDWMTCWIQRSMDKCDIVHDEALSNIHPMMKNDLASPVQGDIRNVRELVREISTMWLIMTTARERKRRRRSDCGRDWPRLCIRVATGQRRDHGVGRLLLVKCPVEAVSVGR